MSKIVQAVNAMILNKEKISEAEIGANGETFFLYDGKYKWSMRKDDRNYNLWYYPGKFSLDHLKSIDGDEWERISMAPYSTKEIGTVEAFESFQELFNLLQAKMLGVDEVLDDIIKDLIPF